MIRQPVSWLGRPVGQAHDIPAPSFIRRGGRGKDGMGRDNNPSQAAQREWIKFPTVAINNSSMCQ